MVMQTPPGHPSHPFRFTPLKAREALTSKTRSTNRRSTSVGPLSDYLQIRRALSSWLVPERFVIFSNLQWICSRSFFSQGVAPFRGFVQERVALARRTIEKNGPDALAQWGNISLFYGCRKSNEDFLYKEEWPQYLDELKGKFKLHIAFSREPPFKPDGSKIYVQDLLWDDRENVADAIINGK